LILQFTTFGQPSQKNRAHDVTSTPTFKDLGIHKKQSQRWQQIAEANGEE
jgi:hypothetical protein